MKYKPQWGKDDYEPTSWELWLWGVAIMAGADIVTQRASIKYMQVKYLLGKEGEIFEAQISGVTDFGMFVELKDSLCEGRVSVRDLKEDHYQFHKETFSCPLDIYFVYLII